MSLQNSRISLENSTKYLVGDLVYIEDNPNQPYSIAKIVSITEEKGRVDMRVTGYYRRRDMNQSNLQRVDRLTAFLPGNEHSYEWNHSQNPYTREEIHNVRLRELITCRGDDDMADRKIYPTSLRGKCHMSRYCPLENAYSYLKKPDMFYFSTVFESDTRSVSVEGNEINVGPMHQATIPPIDKNYMKNSASANLGTLMWNPKLFKANANEATFKRYYKLLRSICIIGRLVDPTFSCKYGDIRQVAAVASRDSTYEYALYFLHKNNYNIENSVKKLVADVEAGSYTVIQDDLDSWVDSDVEIFQKSVMACHKDFLLLQKKFLPWKSVLDLVEFYYLWKTTTGYDKQKRKQEPKILSLYAYNNSNSNTFYTIPHDKLVSVAMESSRFVHNVECVSCKIKKCDSWYQWIPNGVTSNKNIKYYMCPECWIYWKKYGGLKKPDPMDRSCTEETTLKCNVCSKFFHRNDRFNTHIFNNHPYRCSIQPCSQYYNTKEELDVHRVYSHFEGLVILEPSQEILKKKKTYFLADKQWYKIRAKIFRANKQMSMILTEPFIDGLKKLIFNEKGEFRRITKFYPSISKWSPNEINNKPYSTPNTLLESALEPKYLKKFNVHWDGTKIDPSNMSTYPRPVNTTHAVLTTNIKYSMYSNVALSKPGSEASSTNSLSED